MPQLQPVPKLMPVLLLEPKPQLGLAIIIIELHLLGPQLALIGQLEVESRQQQLQVGQQHLQVKLLHQLEQLERQLDQLVRLRPPKQLEFEQLDRQQLLEKQHHLLNYGSFDLSR